MSHPLPSSARRSACDRRALTVWTSLLLCAAVLAGPGPGPAGAEADDARATSSGRGHLLVIGDSLTLEANEHSGLGYDHLRLRMPTAPADGATPGRRWRTVTLVYETGQRVRWGVATVRAALRRNPRISTIVVALGTNDATGRRKDWAAEIRALLDAADGRPVTWLTLEFATTSRAAWRRNARGFNESLATVDADPAYASQLAIADWAAWFPESCARAASFAGDGIHLRRSGNRCRARFMVDLSRMVHEALFTG